jgi:hypothetical protein
VCLGLGNLRDEFGMFPRVFNPGMTQIFIGSSVH